MKGKCNDCEFCFPHQEFGFVCADQNYGEDIFKTLEIEKDCYSEGFEVFVDRTKENEIPFMPGVKLVQLKIDGRKRIDFTDQEGKTISIKFSNAKKMFGDIEISKRILEDTYLVNAIFNNEHFKNGKYLIIK